MTASKPYVGPVSFRPEDEPIFFGREHEADDLISLVVAYPVTLLYAASGAGKTSLINAKLLPALRERDATVLGPARVTGPEESLHSHPENVFSFFLLQRIAPLAAN